MRNWIVFSTMLLLLPLAAFQDTCRRQAEPPPPPPPPAPSVPAPPKPPPVEAGEPIFSNTALLRPRLSAKWEEGTAGPKLVIELMVENTGTSPVRLGFSNSGRVCGVVLDSEAAASKGPRGSKVEGAKGYRFPQMTAQVMGEETFAPGQTRTFRYEVRRSELAESLSPPYTVEAWLCGHEKLRQRATTNTRDGR